MSTDTQQLAQRISATGLPPVNEWQPERVGEIDIRIDRHGTWFHEGREIHRKPLYRLFSTVLRRDPDDAYYLVTPVEKLRIRVEDAPFVAVSMDVSGEGHEQQLQSWTRPGPVLGCCI